MLASTKKKRYERFCELLPKTPLFGHLIECSWKDYWDSFVEYSNSLLWSTMPFWLGAIILYFQVQNGSQTFLDTFTGTFRNGELLVFTIGTVTPITFMTLFEDPKGRFPHRLALGTIAVFLIVLCASFFALQKGKVPTKVGYVYYASLGFAGFAIVLRYIAIVYHKTRYLETTERDLVEPTEAYVDDFDVATQASVEAASQYAEAEAASPAPAQSAASFDDAFARATSVHELPLADKRSGTKAS